MPIAHRYDSERGFHVLTVEGTINLAEFEAAMTKLVRSDDYPPDRDSLWDLRRLDFDNVDGEYWRRIVEVRKRYPERAGARLAHVVEGDLAYGMLRMYQIMSGLDGPDLSQHVAIFRSLEEAESWLQSGD